MFKAAAAATGGGRREMYNCTVGTGEGRQGCE